MSTLKVDSLVEKTSGNGVHIAGHVIQVVSNTNTYTANSGFLLESTSTSYVASALSASITPKFASSKIMISISTTNYRTGDVSVTIYRGSTNLGGSTYGMARLTTAANKWHNVSLVHLDSPNTTSAITYQLYGRAESGTTYIGGNGDQLNNIVLMEIAQ